MNNKRGRPRKSEDYSFHKDLVKTANERLRKLEKVHKGITTSDSEAYTMIQKYAVEYHNTKGKIYKVNTNNGTIRFLNKTEFEMLSDEDKKYYNQRLLAFLDNKTSTKSGIEDKYRKAHKTFMKNYGSEFPNLTLDDYKKFFKTWQDMIEADINSHYSYEDLTTAIKYLDIEAGLTPSQLQATINYINKGDWGSVDPKFLNRNYR